MNWSPDYEKLGKKRSEYLTKKQKEEKKEYDQEYDQMKNAINALNLSCIDTINENYQETGEFKSIDGELGCCRTYHLTHNTKRILKELKKTENMKFSTKVRHHVGDRYGGIDTYPGINVQIENEFLNKKFG